MRTYHYTHMHAHVHTQAIFNYYAARRQPEDTQKFIVYTFEDVEELNKTMDQPELTKFMNDFFPSCFSQKARVCDFFDSRKCNVCMYVCMYVCTYIYV